MQAFNRKPNLVLALGAADINADARQSLDLVLVESEETMCCNGSGWFAPEAFGLLREFDQREKPISFNAHEASRVIGRGFHNGPSRPYLSAPHNAPDTWRQQPFPRLKVPERRSGRSTRAAAPQVRGNYPPIRRGLAGHKKRWPALPYEDRSL